MKKAIKWTVGILGSMILILTTVSLFVLFPPVQQWLTNNFTQYLRNNYGIDSQVGSIRIGFPNSVVIGNFLLQDAKEDTAVSVGTLRVSASLLGMINKQVKFSDIEILDVKANVFREENDTLFNIYPILNAFGKSKEKAEKPAAKKEWEIIPGKITLKNWLLDLKDDHLKSYVHFSIGELYLKFNQFDLNSLLIDVQDLHLANAHGYIHDNKPPDPGNEDISNADANSTQNDPEEGKGITIKADDIQLDNVSLELFLVEQIFINTTLNTADFNGLFCDLNRLKIALDEINVDGAKVQLNVPDSDTLLIESIVKDLPTEIIDTINVHPFGAEMDITVRRLAMTNSEYHMKLEEKERRTDGLDYLNYDITDINIELSNAHIDQDSLIITVQGLSCEEFGGLEVKGLSGTFSITDKLIKADAFNLRTPDSDFTGNIKMSYPSLRKIGANPGALIYEVEIESSVLYLGDVLLSVPSAFSEWPINWNNKLKINECKINGALSDLKIPSLQLSYGKKTKASFSGKVKGLPDIEEMNLDISVDTVELVIAELANLLQDSIMPAGSVVPKYINANAQLAGRLSNMESSLIAHSDLGHFESQSNIALLDESISLNGMIGLSEFGIFENSGAEKNQKMSMQVKYDLNLADNKLAEANLDLHMEKLKLNQYTYEDIRISGHLLDDLFNVQLEVNDSSILMSMTASGTILDTVYAVKGSMDIEKINLDSINLYPQPIEIQLDSEFDFEYANKSDFKGTFKTNHLTISKREHVHTIDELAISLNNSPKNGTNFRLISGVLDAYLIGNVQYYSIPEIINNHIDQYISHPDSIDQYENNYFGFGLDIHQPDILMDIFTDHIKSLEIGRFRGSYDGSANELQMDIIVPTFAYDDFKIDSTKLLIASSNESFKGSLHFTRLGYDTIFTHDILLSTEYINDHFVCDLTALDSKKKKILSLPFKISSPDSTYLLQIIPENLILDYQNWNIPQTNYLQFYKDEFDAHDFSMSYTDEKFDITSPEAALRLEITNLNLLKFLSLFENSNLKETVKGNIDGSVDVKRSIRGPSISADFKSKNIQFQGQTIDQLLFSSNNYPDSLSALNFTLDAKNNQLKFGYLNNDEQGQEKITVVSDLRDLSFFSFLLPETISSPLGQLIGEIEINRSDELSDVKGFLKFTNASVIVTPFNIPLIFKDELITIDQNKMSLQGFTISDSTENKIEFNGDIQTSDLKQFDFNISGNSQKFQWINAAPSKSKVIHGDLFAGLDIQLNGTNNEPKINTAITVQDGTNVTYVMPGQELEMISDEGIVYFAKSDIQEDALQKKNIEFIGDSIAKTFKGLNLDARLIVNENAKFKVITDPNSGDYSEFKIMGNLRYTYDPANQGRVNGIVEFKDDGFYELSFYGLVKKKFLFDPGSSVNWSNRVMDGNLNFTLKHIVLTNSAGLVSGDISDYEKSRYNQRLPYEVLLHISGTIAEPNIQFAIDLPEKHRSSYPTIDSKLAALNQPEMEAERNKQVFALLVATTFIPESSGSAGSGTDNFATTAARNSVNSIFTQQLNNLTSQIIKGVDVNFGLNTFEDYSSGASQLRTQMDVQISKNLFNNRISVEVESHIDVDGNVPQIGQDKTSGMMEFAVLYKLTENGNYRIRAFRENAFDLYDGEIQNAGLALIFIKDFDKKQRKRYSKP